MAVWIGLGRLGDRTSERWYQIGTARTDGAEQATHLHPSLNEVPSSEAGWWWLVIAEDDPMADEGR